MTISVVPTVTEPCFPLREPAAKDPKEEGGSETPYPLLVIILFLCTTSIL